MPCKEMMELEATLERYTDRRCGNTATDQERRKGTAAGFRASVARFAYIVIHHRHNCRVCRAEQPAFG